MNLDPFADCTTAGHMFGPIQGNVRHCERFDCTTRDAYDPDDFLTEDGDIYDPTDPDRPRYGFDGPDAYQLRL